MKKFRRVNIVPSRVKPSRTPIELIEIKRRDGPVIKELKGEINNRLIEITDRTNEVHELRKELNTKLREVANETNRAIASLTAGLMDMGIWANGEWLRVTSEDFGYAGVGANNQDVPFRHHLGRAPQYALQTIPDGPFVAGGGSAYQWPVLRRGVTPWTDTYVYFRPNEDIYNAGDSCRIDVLLIP